MTEETTSPTSGTRDKATSVVIAMTVMNVCTYAFTLLAARLTNPVEYGQVVAAINLLTVIQVLALAIQAVAARRIASDPAHVAQIERVTLKLTATVSLAIGALLLLAVPLVQRLLQLDGPAVAIIIALGAIPLTYTGGQMGILQGERRWGALSLAYVMAGVPRLVVGTALILVKPETIPAVLGVTIGYVFPVIVGFIALRGRRSKGPRSSEHTPLSMLREGTLNSQALLAYFALSSGDILVARQVLDGHDAGLYAGALIMTKTMLFLPQFVVVLSFPDMATASARRRALWRSLSIVLALGGIAVLASWLLSSIALFFVGGSKYGEIESHLWQFALLGLLLAMIQLMVYSVLARQGARTAFLVWLALAALVGFGLQTETYLELAWVAIAVNAVLFAALLIVSLFTIRGDSPAAGTVDALAAESIN